MTNEQKQMLETLTEKINECEQLAYKLASSFDVGEARIKAFQAYENIRLALAVGKIGN